MAVLAVDPAVRLLRAKTFRISLMSLNWSGRIPTSAVKTSDFIIVADRWRRRAAGKSSTAGALSERFHLLHVDTGSFYRAVTAELLRRGVRPDDLPAVRTALAGLKLGTRVTGRRAEIELDGRGVGDEIRSKAVNENVSFFAAIPELRAGAPRLSAGPGGRGAPATVFTDW